MKFYGTDQRIYLKCEGSKFIGFIKVGKKKLFIYDDIGSINELYPLCVLDFYVYEGCQRTGFGKEIFLKMIECEKIEPRKLGYDRPSSKLLSFLKKHFHLSEYVPQNNKYVVYNDYFLSPSSSSSASNKYNQFETQISSPFSNQTAYHIPQSQQKTFHQFKKDIYEPNTPNTKKDGIYNKDEYIDDKYYENNSMTSKNNIGDDNNNTTTTTPGSYTWNHINQEDYIQKMTLPYNYQYKSSSSEYGAFLNVNPKQNYHYSSK